MKNVPRRQYSLVPFYFVLVTSGVLSIGALYLVKNLGWDKSSVLTLGLAVAVVISLIFHLLKSKFP